MRRLLLLRHAKSERGEPGERDRDRVLAKRGRGDAPRVGAYMAHHGLLPDVVLVSPAARTRQTWTLLSGTLETAPTAKFDDRLYEASPQAILQVIKETDPEIKTLLVVGHNPGLQELAAMLIAAGDVETRQRLKEDFPTCALAVIDFAVNHWGQLHRHAGRLEHFVTPRSLEAATD